MIAQGFKVAHGAEPGRAYFDAIAEFEEEVDAMVWEWNANAQERDAMEQYAKAGR